MVRDFIFAAMILLPPLEEKIQGNSEEQ
jgi:hypothetical protein